MAYTAAQIVTLVSQICKLPGRTVQIGQLLNVILDTYSLTLDEDIIRQTTTLSIGPQAIIPHPYPLPSDYLRYYDVWYLVNGEPFYLTQMELKDFDALFTGDGIDNYPERFATDMAVQPGGLGSAAAPNMYFYPPPSVALTVTLRYRPRTGAITAPETSSQIPFFPDQRTLIKDLSADALILLADEGQRGEQLANHVEKQMRKYLIMSDDKEGFAQTVKLDPNTFRTRQNLPPSKKTGF